MSKNKKKKKINAAKESSAIATNTTLNNNAESDQEKEYRKTDITLSLVLVGVILITFAFLGSLDSKNDLFAAPGNWLTEALHVNF